ncbi:MAG: response regulator [Candidatus Omnitrophica bacterium]|nr:response regulator [Candidatus Omnitrophota bacterium]
MEEKLLTIDEVTVYLKIPKSTLYKLCENNQIPSVKIGKQLRFRKSSLDRWLNEKENKSGVFQEVTSPDPAIRDKTVSPNPKAVLLIDDDLLVLKTLARFLKNQGYQVELAGSGEEALEKACRQEFSLVIADVRMPGINGIETIKRLRQINRKEASEIIITGYMDTQAEKAASSLGITDYLYKPFEISEFLETVKKKNTILN